MTSGWIIIGLLAAFALWSLAIYNGLVTLRQRTNQSFADVDVQLKQRHDLIPALVEAVKGSAAHERETLDAVIKARQAAVAAPPSNRRSPPRTVSRALLASCLRSVRRILILRPTPRFNNSRPS